MGKSTAWILLAFCGCSGPFYAADPSVALDGGDVEASAVVVADSGGGMLDRRVVNQEAGSQEMDPDARSAAEEATGHDANGLIDGGSSSGSSGSSGSSSGSSSGTTIPCDGAGLSVHHTGTSLTWTDCVPVGTYDQAEALKACQAWCAANDCYAACYVNSVCGQDMVLGQTSPTVPTTIMGWSWTAPNAGNVSSISATTNACTVVGTWD